MNNVAVEGGWLWWLNTRILGVGRYRRRGAPDRSTNGPAGGGSLLKATIDFPIGDQSIRAGPKYKQVPAPARYISQCVTTLPFVAILCHNAHSEWRVPRETPQRDRQWSRLEAGEDRTVLSEGWSLWHTLVCYIVQPTTAPATELLLQESATRGRSQHPNQ